MPVTRATLFVLAIVFGSWSTALASPTSIVDTTAGTATSDGAVLPGEYVGSSVGINAGFGDVIGIGSRIHLDSDAAGDLNVGIVSGGSPLSDAIVIYIVTARRTPA